MPKAKPWIQAFRLRTLPLAIGAITMGAFAALADRAFDLDTYLLSIITAILLQILSNLANDYGDFKKGTDNDKRVGPQRALQSGAVTEKAMRTAIIIFSLLSLISGIALLYFAFENFSNWETLVMLAVGILAIGAAIKYTTGKNAYGYHGLGDVSVFIFFGLVAVCGTYFLMAHTLHAWVALPAVGFGCLAVGVLNINNTRDIANDKESGKLTVAGWLGFKRAKIYQVVLIAISFVALAFYIAGVRGGQLTLPMLVLFLPIDINTLNILKIQEGEEQKFNPQLKLLSISSAALAVGLFLLLILVRGGI